MQKELAELLNKDLYRYGIKKESELSWMGRFELYGYRYTKWLRRCRYYKEQRKVLRFLYARIQLHVLSQRYGIHMSYGTEIGPGLYLGHAGNIVINEKAHIGKNVNIAQGVTIGIANGGKKPGVPTIGNDVWIGTNAVLAGGIVIGDDVMIAPNTFVNFDVPSHAIVVSQKASVIFRQSATENYINNKVE